MWTANGVHSPVPAWNTRKDNCPTQSTQEVTGINVNIVGMVNTCCTRSSVSRSLFPPSPHLGQSHARGQNGEGAVRPDPTPGSRPFGKHVPMTSNQGRCLPLAQCPGGSGLAVVCLLWSPPSPQNGDQRLDPSQALSGKFQTSPAILQMADDSL